MTEFVFGPYRLEVDVEATRAWYVTATPPAAVTAPTAGTMPPPLGPCRRRWRISDPWDWTGK